MENFGGAGCTGELQGSGPYPLIQRHTFTLTYRPLSW